MKRDENGRFFPGVPVDGQNNEGQTPLFVAAYTRKREVKDSFVFIR